MRIRSVKPEWLSHELLAAASDEARVLSIGLILMADDEGRGRGSVAAIVAEVWRFDMAREDGAKAPEVFAKARRALAELSAIGWVRLYEASGQTYFEILTFKKHQKIDKPTKSKIPEPSTDSSSPHRVLHELSPSLSRAVAEDSTTDQDQDQDQERIRKGSGGEGIRGTSRPYDAIDRTEAKQAIARQLIREFGAEYRKRKGVDWIPSAHLSYVHDVASACLTTADPAATASRLIAAVYADSRRADKGWPWRFIAADFGELLGRPGAAEPDVFPAPLTEAEILAKYGGDHGRA
jgi:hypothetical protein